MILLNEAIERFNAAAKPYGLGVARRRRTGKSERLVKTIDSALASLELPAELSSFWIGYDPGSIVRPAFDGFIPLEESLERRLLDCPPAPAVLYPIADWTHSRIWIELASKDHPGGRIFHSYHDESEVSLWAFGISGLLDLLSTAFERDLLDDRRGGLHATHFDAVIRRHLDDAMGLGGQRRFEAVDRSQFPVHWQTAEGLAVGHFELRGATHTVTGLRSERKRADSVTATLQGFFELDVAGGPLHGCVGTFSDDTGSIQVFVPKTPAMKGSLGHNGEVEIDVIAMPPNGSDVDTLSARQDVEYAVSAGLTLDDQDVFVRLMQQMRELDTSVVATALRPIW